MACTTHFTDEKSCGYLISRTEFDGMLRDCVGEPALYAEVARCLGDHGWTARVESGAPMVEIAGRLAGAGEAYALFAEDHAFHERVYQACMSVWR